MSLRIIASRFAGSCPLCSEPWRSGAPIAPFPDTSAHVGAWGHPACVTADGMGQTSVTEARERVAEIKAQLRNVTKQPIPEKQEA